MNMTKEQLEMLERLKKAIDGYMGEWKEGDLSYSLLSKRIIFVDKEVCKFLKDPKEELFIKDNVLRIPPFCTPDGKRCLTKMLTDKGKEYLYEYYHTSITILLRSNDYYTAILKALIVQEGV